MCDLKLEIRLWLSGHVACASTSFCRFRSWQFHRPWSRANTLRESDRTGALQNELIRVALQPSLELSEAHEATVLAKPGRESKARPCSPKCLDRSDLWVNEKPRLDEPMGDFELATRLCLSGHVACLSTILCGLDNRSSAAAGRDEIRYRVNT